MHLTPSFRTSLQEIITQLSPNALHAKPPTPQQPQTSSLPYPLNLGIPPQLPCTHWQTDFTRFQQKKKKAILLDILSGWIEAFPTSNKIFYTVAHVTHRNPPTFWTPYLHPNQ